MYLTLFLCYFSSSSSLPEEIKKVFCFWPHRQDKRERKEGSVRFFIPFGHCLTPSTTSESVSFRFFTTGTISPSLHFYRLLYDTHEISRIELLPANQSKKNDLPLKLLLMQSQTVMSVCRHVPFLFLPSVCEVFLPCFLLYISSRTI